MRLVHILVAYVVAILGFAAVYTFVFPHDFYHSYVRYEPDIRDLIDRSQRDIAQAIDDQLSARSDLGGGIMFVLANGLSIQGEQEGALTASINMGGALRQGDTQQLLITRLPVVISWLGLRTVQKEGAPETMVEDSNELKKRVRTIYIARDPQRAALDQTILAHTSTDQTTVTDALGRALELVELSDAQRHDLFAILNVERGFPAYAGGLFWRMLYFSAITITTVGYGDIVPLTSWGRGLAALEATLGIVLLGLLVSRLT